MTQEGPLSGQQVANKYRLGELLGSGGMGAVYKAHDTRLNRPVAMKVMRPANPVSTSELQDYTKRFQEEALRLASLKHRGIPHIYEYFEEAGYWFLVMEFIEGETLKDSLERHGGRLPVDEVLKIGLQLADVLNYLHTPLPNKPPIIFRDLKPANVMIAPDSQVYLIDFGIARLFAPGKSQDTFVALSQGYGAPEQHGTAQTTVRSDIYSLGATLHHLLSGTHSATSPFLFASLPIQQPPQLAALIAHMVAIDTAHRPVSMAEVKEALQRMIDQTAAAAPPTSAVPAPTTPVNPAFFAPMQPSPQQGIAAAPLAGAPILAGSSGSSPLPPEGRPTRAASGTPPRGTTLVTHESPEVITLAWSPDGQRIASGVKGNVDSISSSASMPKIDVWHAITGKTLKKLHSFGNPDAIVWSPDGKYIVACMDKWEHYDGKYTHNITLIWESGAKKEAERKANWKLWHRERVSVERILDPILGELLLGEYLFSSYNSSSVPSYNAPRLILWSPDSSKVAVVGYGGKLAVSSLRGRKPLVQRSLDSTSCNGDAVAWSPDSTHIAWGAGNDVPVWDVRSNQQEGRHLLTYREHRSPIVAVSWSPDGRQITSRSEDGYEQVWDIDSGQTQTTFIAAAEKQRWLASLVETIKERCSLSSYGAWKAVPTDEGIEIRTAAHGETVFVYRGHFGDKTAQHWSSEVKALSWSPDGTRIAFARFDGRIYVWQAV